jgi:type I restriction enzyme M protein
MNEEGFDKAAKYSVKEIIERNYNLDLCGFPHEEEEILPPLELIAHYKEKRAALNLEIDGILKKVVKILEAGHEEKK